MFVVRVTLHNETDYKRLHEEMHARGFRRTVASTAGVRYRLPDGTYKRDTGASCSSVCDLAKAAAAAAGHRNPAVVVGETAGLTWNGLEKVSSVEAYLASQGLM